MKVLTTIKRHKLLNLLSKQRLTDEDNRLSYDVLCAKLNVNFIQLKLIMSELYISKEILACDLYHHQLQNLKTDRTETNISGLFITDIGITSVSNNKYVNIILQKVFKLVFQISIPLVITFMSVYTFISSKRNLKESDKSIEIIENKLIELEKDIETSESLLLYQNNKKDSLSLRLNSLETSFNKYLINNPPITGKEKSQ